MTCLPWERVSDTTGEGANCGTPLDGGSPCPQNYTNYTDPACPDACVPIPFAGYADRAPCPAGYVPDLASEGQYCLPENGDVCAP